MGGDETGRIRSPRAARRLASAGLTLAETLVAFALVSLSALLLAQALFTGLGAAQRADERLMAAHVTAEALAQIDLQPRLSPGRIGNERISGAPGWSWQARVSYAGEARRGMRLVRIDLRVLKDEREVASTSTLRLVRSEGEGSQ